jgi:hypothetical protein
MQNSVSCVVKFCSVWLNTIKYCLVLEKDQKILINSNVDSINRAEKERTSSNKSGKKSKEGQGKKCEREEKTAETGHQNTKNTNKDIVTQSHQTF